MDRERAKHILDNLEVLKAFVNGETIQFKDDYGGWKDVPEPSFFPTFEYRVKPSVTITFRRFLWKNSNGNVEIGIWNQNIYGDQSNVETRSNFVKWIEETQTDEFFL